MTGWLLALTFVAAQATVLYPSYTNVIPCVNTAENCGKTYYQIQQSLQSQLAELYNSAADAQDAASNLLTQVQDPITGLKTISDQLMDVIDPDNTRTAGGSYLVLTNKTTIRGVTPYMYTLSQRLLNSVNARGADMKNAANSLKAGMDSVTKQLLEAQSTANNLLQEISTTVPRMITTSSGQVRDYLTQIDAKMTSDANTFNNQAASAPSATLTALQSALALESNDANVTLSKLQSILTEIQGQPAELDDYINGLLADLQATVASQEASGDALAVQKTTTFTSELVKMTSTLSQALQGLLTTESTSPYYNNSVPGYILKQRALLESQIQSANQTQQAWIRSLSNGIQTLVRSVSSAFQPILADINSKVAQLVAADQIYQRQAQAVIDDATGTTSKANTSFTNVKTNLEGTWNLTEGILTGQVTDISASLLNQIGSMTSQAGSEVNKLQDIMNSVANQSLASDSVRRTILADSRNQVLSYIGNNEAAMNSSFATVFGFLNNSESQLSLISDVLDSLTGSGQAKLKHSADSVVASLQDHITSTQDGINKLYSDLLTSVAGNIEADKTAAQTNYDGLVAASQTQVDQTGALLTSMAATNDEAVKSMSKSLTDIADLMKEASDQSVQLLDTVNQVPALAHAQQTAQTAATDKVVSNANTILNRIQSDLKAKLLSIQNQIQQTASGLSTSQTTGLQSLASKVSSASTDFDSKVSELMTNFSSKMVELQAQASMSPLQTADMQSQLTDAAANIDKTYQAQLTQLKADSDIAPVQAAVKEHLAGVKSDSLAQASSQSTDAKSGIESRLTSLQTTLSGLEGQITTLTSSISSMKDAPSDLVNKANQLQSQFSSQLTDLKSNILSFSAKNDQKSSDFSALESATLGAGLDASGKPGIETLISELTKTVADEVAQTNAKIDSMKAEFDTMIQAGGTDLNASVNQFMSTIAQHKTDLNSTLESLITNAYSYMDKTYETFEGNVTRTNDTLFEGYKTNQALQGRLSSLSADVASTIQAYNDMDDPTVMSGLISAYGTDVQKQISDLLKNSQTSLTEAQTAELNRQILIANKALGAADNLKTTGSDLADAVETALQAVTSAQGEIQANTNFVKQKLQSVVSASDSAVKLTSDDVAAIIQEFSSSSSASKSAIQAQIAATGDAQAQMNKAVEIWNRLRQEAGDLTNDAIDDLKTTRDDVITHAEKSVSDLSTDVTKQLDQVRKSASDATSPITASHAKDMEYLDQAASDLEAAASSAVAEKSNYERSVSSLETYVANLVEQLKARYNSIVNQGPAFRTSLESAAAQDIAGING